MDISEGLGILAVIFTMFFAFSWLIAFFPLIETHGSLDTSWFGAGIVFFILAFIFAIASRETK